MTRKNYWKFFLLVLFIASGACKDKKEGEEAQGGAVPATVIKVRQEAVEGNKSYPASLKGVVSSDVRAKISGYITEVFVKEGQEVTKGQPLLQLETETLSEDARAARARVNAAQVEVDKLIPLVEQNIISVVQLETARANLSQARSTYNSVAARVAYATVRSPIDGFVGSITYQEGSLVSPADPAPLTRVSDIDSVSAYFSMNEGEYLDFIQDAPGNSVEEKVNNFPEVSLELSNGKIYDLKGKIETVTGQVNPNTGTVSFKAVFPNPERILTDGNSGMIRIPQPYDDHILVPQSATYELQGDVYVYRMSVDHTIGSVKINFVDNVNNQYVVSEGLAPGDVIVAQGVSMMRAGQKIQPKEVPYDSIIQPVEPIFN